MRAVDFFHVPRHSEVGGGGGGGKVALGAWTEKFTFFFGVRE